MSRLRAITPMIPVADVAASVRFFESLGFVARSAREDYAYLYRDTVALRLLSAPPGTDMDDPSRQQEIYIDVDGGGAGIDALYAAFRPSLAALPAGCLRAPHDLPYGQREFHVIHGAVLLRFGAPLKESPAS